MGKLHKQDLYRLDKICDLKPKYFILKIAILLVISKVANVKKNTSTNVIILGLYFYIYIIMYFDSMTVTYQ